MIEEIEKEFNECLGYLDEIGQWAEKYGRELIEVAKAAKHSYSPQIVEALKKLEE